MASDEVFGEVLVLSIFIISKMFKQLPEIWSFGSSLIWR
jgi:hypothetical protein